MRCLIFALILTVSTNLVAVTLASQELIDQYVHLATTTDTTELAGKKGKFSCSFPVIHDPSLRSRGKSIDEAIQRLQLLCIKEQCNKLSDVVHQSLGDFLNMPENELRDFMEFLGYSIEEIEAALINKKSMHDGSLPKQTCATGTPTFRTAAFEFCFSTPVHCQKS